MTCQPPNRDAEAEADAWLDAAHNREVDASIRAIHDLIAQETEARRPRCDVSGRCCRFEQWGHRLYVTGLEAAWFVRQAASGSETGHPGGAGLRARSGESSERAGAPAPLRADVGEPMNALSISVIEAAQSRGDCPFLGRGRCSVHTIRPMGCRVYFCDPTAQQWQQDLFERAHRELADLHEAHSIPYEFAEWRSLLRRLVVAAPRLAASILVTDDSPPSPFVQVGRS